MYPVIFCDKMNMMINPQYEHLRSFLEQLPENFETLGRVIHSGRNLIKVISLEGLTINVKRYAVPPFVNRVAYSFFRQSKGKRAFLYPSRLLEKGIETPEPIAYLEERKMGLIGHSYFVSVQSSYSYNFCRFGKVGIEGNEELIAAFARFTARLHENGVLHRDYSPGNILYDKLADGWHFSLVDINRMYFGKVDMKKGCANFARLWGKTPFFTLLAAEYARARRMDEAECIRLVLHYRKMFWNRYRRRHRVWFDLDI